jgi:hypothetical protein
LHAARKNPALVFDATPVCGRWQLVFTVENFAPALPQVVVEQRQPDGAWRELRARHTIEFRAQAARPRVRPPIARLFSTPIDDPTAPLRVAVRGLGQVALRDVFLTDGVTKLRLARRSPGAKKILGRAAPRHGFPDIRRTLAVWPLEFPRLKTP